MRRVSEIHHPMEANYSLRTRKTFKDTLSICCLKSIQMEIQVVPTLMFINSWNRESTQPKSKVETDLISFKCTTK